MQINNHLSPSSLGHGSRPDQAGNGSAKGPQFQPATATEPATETDTTTAVAPVEETEETQGPGKSGQSPAHQARAQLSGLALAGLENHNFGWLVSQIARGLDISAPAPDGEGSDETSVIVDETDGGEGTTAADDTVPTGEEEVPGDGTTEVGTLPVEEDPVVGLLDALENDGTEVEATTGPVVNLVDTLLEEDEDNSDAV